jgi:hypothetical protein
LIPHLTEARPIAPLASRMDTLAPSRGHYAVTLHNAIQAATSEIASISIFNDIMSNGRFLSTAPEFCLPSRISDRSRVSHAAGRDRAEARNVISVGQPIKAVDAFRRLECDGHACLDHRGVESLSTGCLTEVAQGYLANYGFPRDLLVTKLSHFFSLEDQVTTPVLVPMVRRYCPALRPS